MKNKIKALLLSLSSLFNSQLLLHQCNICVADFMAVSSHTACLILHYLSQITLDQNWIWNTVSIKTCNIRFGKKWQDFFWKGNKDYWILIMCLWYHWIQTKGGNLRKLKSQYSTTANANICWLKEKLSRYFGNRTCNKAKWKRK